MTTAQQASEAYVEAAQAVERSGVIKELSPPARTVAQAVVSAVGELAQGASPATVALSVARSAAQEVVSSIVSEAIGEVAGAVPLLGAVVDMVIGIVNVVANASEQDRRDKAATCADWYWPVTGTGPQLRVVPADIFNNSAEKRGFPEGTRGAQGGVFLWDIWYGSREMSSVGRALIDLTETDSWYPLRAKKIRDWAKPDRRDKVNPSHFIAEDKHLAFLRKIGAQTSSMWQKLGLPASVDELAKLGLSDARRALYATLRKGIQAQWKQGDGGTSLWPIYIDMLRADVAAGRLPFPFVTVFLPRLSDCYALDPRVLGSVKSLLRAWTQEVKPYYVQDKRKRLAFGGHAAPPLGQLATLSREKMGAVMLRRGMLGRGKGRWRRVGP